MQGNLVSADPPAGQICRVPEGGLSAVSSFSGLKS